MSGKVLKIKILRIIKKKQFTLIKILYIYVRKFIGGMDMSIALRKLAMLEKSFEEKEKAAKLEGLTSSPINRDLEIKVRDLMDKVRAI